MIKEIRMEKMPLKPVWMLLGWLPLVVLALASCHDRDNAVAETVQYIPEAPDYADATMWYARENAGTGTGAADTGVTICYNSVSDVRYIKPVVAVPCAMCINPVNWRTDATPATLHDTVTVSLSPEHHVLVVKGYSGSEYEPIRGFLNVGDFHGAEPWLYQECLRENIQARVRAYYEGRGGDGVLSHGR